VQVVKERAISKAQMQDFYRRMLLIRRFEEACSEWYMRGKIGGFLHLYIGEEACAVGSISCLKPADYIVSHYREHGHALARGLDPKRIMAELFGRTTGTSKGKGGSMHLFDASKGFLGGYAIVGGMLPIACGLGVAAKHKGEGQVALAFFGDGAVNEGEFHESINLASLWKLPVVFFCENNGFGMGTAIQKTFSGPAIYKLANSYGIPGAQVDGMDVLAVYQATSEAVERARSGAGPSFVEALTYRFRGHSMADPVQYRKKEEETRWRQRDPILHFPKKLKDEGAATAEDLQRIEQEVDGVMEEAVRFADGSPEPPPEELYTDILAE